MGLEGFEGGRRQARAWARPFLAGDCVGFWEAARCWGLPPPLETKRSENTVSALSPKSLKPSIH